VLIDPNNINYDEHVSDLDQSIKHYNRMIILLQGLLDRSNVFSPHPGIKLTDAVQLERWVNLIRDEEDVIACEPIDYKEWKAENNKGTKRGHWIYSTIDDPKAGQDGRGYSVNTRPRVIQVTAVKRDKSAVKVSWPWGTRWGYEHVDKYSTWGKWGEWPVDRMCHQWIPAGEYLNLNHYNLGDYKPFLCDRTMMGKYLSWAPMLLNAEDWRRKQVVEGQDVVQAMESKGRIPRKVKKIVVVEEEEEQNW